MKWTICDELSLQFFSIIKPFHCVRELLIIAELCTENVDQSLLLLTAVWAIFVYWIWSIKEISHHSVPKMKYLF